MSESGSRLSTLDQLGIDILRALVDHEGEADSTALRKYLGLNDDSARSRFNYRVTEYLEPEGLIETHQPEPEPGKYPPKNLMLTEDGRELLEDLGSESAGNGIADRLQRLEEQVDGLRQENQELREENQELKELVKGSDIEMVTGRVQELTDDVDRLQGKVSNLQDVLGEINGDPLVGNELAQVNLNTAFILGNALRELMIEEWGEDRVMGMVDQKKTKFEDSGDLL